MNHTIHSEKEQNKKQEIVSLIYNELYNSFRKGTK